LPGWSVGRVDGVAVAVALFDQIQLRPGCVTLRITARCLVPPGA
jgi:hypothetical protein